MNGLVLIVDGDRTCIRYTLDEIVPLIASAHRAGRSWDVRRKTTGQGYRVLTDDEAAVLVGAVAVEVAL